MMNSYNIKFKSGITITAFGTWYEFNKRDGILNVVVYDEETDAEDLSFSTDLDNVEYIICAGIKKMEIFDRA